MSEFPYNILVCPKTKNPLEKATQEQIDRVNSMIQKGNCKNQSNEIVNQTVSEGFIDNKEKRFYLVIDEIPVLMYNKSILL